MDNSILISVVIPAYNREDLIRKCIDSILNQTYKNLEIIVVDDCSSDKTADIVDCYEDERVKKCIRLEKNSGACYARNRGASAAQGAYIAFQDSDDVWLPEKLEKQVKYLEAGNYDMVFCGMKRVNRFQNREWYFPLYEFDEKKDAQYQILYENCVSTQCILIRKNAFEKVKFDNSIKKFQDWDFAIRAAETIKLGYLKEELVVAEVQENSISKNVSRHEALLVIYNKYADKILKDAKMDAHFLKKLADDFYRREPEKAAELYAKSLKRAFHLRVLVKLMISRLKL